MSVRLRSLLSSLIALAAGGLAVGCATLPEPKLERHTFPKNAYTGPVSRPYSVLGPVRSKVDFVSLDPGHDEKLLCRNYYNKSVRELLKYARQQGADAVINVESVVFLEDGRRETYKTPECSDDGGEGQILTQGIAVKWKGEGTEMGSWTAEPRDSRPAHRSKAPKGTAQAAPAASVPVVVPEAASVETAPLATSASAPEPEPEPELESQPGPAMQETPSETVPEPAPAQPKRIVMEPVEPSLHEPGPFAEPDAPAPTQPRPDQERVPAAERSRAVPPGGSSFADPRALPWFRH